MTLSRSLGSLRCFSGLFCDVVRLLWVAVGVPGACGGAPAPELLLLGTPAASAAGNGCTSMHASALICQTDTPRPGCKFSTGPTSSVFGKCEESLVKRTPGCTLHGVATAIHQSITPAHQQRTQTAHTTGNLASRGMTTREPAHAGSWYEGSGSALNKQLCRWLEDVPDSGIHAQAVIGPHAGYRYCAHVLAHAYKHIKPEQVSRVFLLGPSHHKYTRKCMLSRADVYKTPLGNMEVDQAVYQELHASGAFELMDLDVDEEEHSLELHTPFIMHVMAGRTFTVVPVVVGSLTPDSEAKYASLFSKYWDDPSNLFVISSDFCHWGRRFSYTYYDETQGPIWKSIQALDSKGMAAIESGVPSVFHEYMKEYQNTICGKHPIGILLTMMQSSGGKFEIKFRHYDQSSKCTSPSDSSVSYAAATITRLVPT